MVNASGRWLDHAIYVALILISGAICVHVISVLDKKRRQSEEKYETLVKQSDDGINIYQDGKLAYSSPRMTEILGYPIEEIMSGDMGRFVAPADAAFIAGFQASLKAKRPVPERFRIDLTASDGRLVPVEVRARQIDYRGRPGCDGCGPGHYRDQDIRAGNPGREGEFPQFTRGFSPGDTGN